MICDDLWWSAGSLSHISPTFSGPLGFQEGISKYKLYGKHVISLSVSHFFGAESHVRKMDCFFRSRKPPYFTTESALGFWWFSNRSIGLNHDFSHGTDPPAHWNLDAIPETPTRYLQWDVIQVRRHGPWFVGDPLIYAPWQSPKPTNKESTKHHHL